MKRMPLVLAGLLVPALLQAQLADPSTRALGMGGAYTSLARGYEAVYWNPAMLATTGRPGFTIGLPHLNVEVGSNVYGLKDFLTYANSGPLSDAAKHTLLDKMASDTSLAIRVLGGVQPFGLSIGPVALAVGSTFEGDLAVGKDAVELALFGNATRTAPGQFFTARGSSGFGWGATTAAASLALPFPMPVGRLSIGITGKYTIGHFLASAGDLGTRIGASPSFSAVTAGQAIYTNYGQNCDSFKPTGTDVCGGQAGKGISADLGAALQFAHGGITLSAVAVNAIGSMTWDDTRLVYERMRRQVTQDVSGHVVTVTTDSTRLETPAAIDADPAARALKDSLLAHASFAKLLRFGFALRSGMLSLGGAMQMRLQQGLDQQPSQLVAAGAEYRLLGFLPLRVGASWDFGEATTLSAGTGLQLLGINIDASIANISGTVHPGVRVGLGVGLIW
jgi:hypothetical protein